MKQPSEMVPSYTAHNETLDYLAQHLNQFHKNFLQYYPYIALCFCLCGLCTNLCLIRVLCRPCMRSVVNRLLTYVAVIDTCLIASYSVYLIHFKIEDRHECPVHLYTYNWTLFQMLHADFSVYARACTIWLSVAIAGYSKYIAALSTPVRENARVADRLALGITTAVLMSASPIFLSNCWISEGLSPPADDITCPPNGSHYYTFGPPEMDSERVNLLLKLAFWTNGMLLKFAPCLLLSYFLCFILHALYAHGRRRKQKFSRVQQETVAKVKKGTPATILLAVILFTTLMCEIPNAVTSLLAAMFFHSDFIKNVYASLGDVFDLLSIFNCFTTSIFYCLMSQAFRETCMLALCPRATAGECAQNEIRPNTSLCNKTVGQSSFSRAGSRKMYSNSKELLLPAHRKSSSIILESAIATHGSTACTSSTYLQETEQENEEFL